MVIKGVWLARQLNCSGISFWKQVRIQHDSALSLMYYFSHYFLKDKMIFVFMSSKRVFNDNLYLNVTFLPSVCLITHVPRSFQVRNLIQHSDFMNHFFTLTPTLYYCATEDYGLNCIVIRIFIFKLSLNFFNSEHHNV